MTISVPEIIALLKRTNPDSIDAIKAFDFNSPQAKPFIKFCEAVYSKGFSHGTHDANDPLFNLLAIIHRDGGHYVAQHGITKAVEDATEIVTGMRRDG